MILAFDPIAEELIVDFETDDPPATVPMKRLVVKYYAPTAGTVACTMDGTGLAFAFYPIPGEPGTMALAPIGERSWRLMFITEDGNTES